MIYFLSLNELIRANHHQTVEPIILGPSDCYIGTQSFHLAKVHFALNVFYLISNPNSSSLLLKGLFGKSFFFL